MCFESIFLQKKMEFTFIGKSMFLKIKSSLFWLGMWGGVLSAAFSAPCAPSVTPTRNRIRIDLGPQPCAPSVTPTRNRIRIDLGAQPCVPSVTTTGNRIRMDLTVPSFTPARNRIRMDLKVGISPLGLGPDRFWDPKPSPAAPNSPIRGGGSQATRTALWLRWRDSGSNSQD